MSKSRLFPRSYAIALGIALATSTAASAFPSVPNPANLFVSEAEEASTADALLLFATDSLAKEESKRNAYDDKIVTVTVPSQRSLHGVFVKQFTKTYSVKDNLSCTETNQIFAQRLDKVFVNVQLKNTIRYTISCKSRL